MTDYNPYMPPVAPIPPKKGHPIRVFFIVLGSILVFVIGVSAIVTGMSGVKAPTHSVNTPAPSAGQPAAPAEPAVAAPLQAKDFTISLKTTSKQCFGSAGCDLVVTPQVTYAGSASDLDGRTCQITYDVTGGQDGAVTDTINATGSDFLSMPVVIMTTKSSAVISATVTEVDCT